MDLSANAIFVYLLVAIFSLMLVMIALHFLIKIIEYLVREAIEAYLHLASTNREDRAENLETYWPENKSGESETALRSDSQRGRRWKNLELAVLICLFLATMSLPISFKFFSQQPSPVPPAGSQAGMAKPSPATPAPAGLEYSTLQDYLTVRNWKPADGETYELLLKLAGDKSHQRGYIDYKELENFPCDELKKIDSLWREASDGKLGFSAQQIIYREQGQSWQKLYDKIEWGRLQGDSFTLLVDRELNWQTRRLEYKSGMAPNFENPPAGHLPVTIGLVRGKEFPQFAELCEF
ncbi:GUN4 domain-containing protein [Kamptonema formosum]|uniref:GUN4 domain-containing protein n=1 Tax=Kamptonema formosum TaxID=331992 RepID=UPI0003728F09|nr:GUN4 domain-containing protein [Oscillatoria sp. PCC 10802]